jgi:glycosyltransferase involved in cell wall biosynthesis
MPDHHPKISVCIPTFNCGRYVRQAIDSVLRQSRQDFEIIVYDDASTDNTPHVVVAVPDQRVRYFRNPRNLGVAATRNHCLAVAAGKYIAWLDADDLYYSQALEIQNAVLDCYSRVGLVHGAYHVIDQDGRRLPDWPPPFSSHVIENGREAFRELILANYIATPAVMARRECYDLAGPFSESVGKIGEDWDMWLRMALHTDLAFTSTAVMQCRQHNHSATATTRQGERLRCDIRVVKRVLPLARDMITDFATLHRQAHAALAAKALLHGNDAFTKKDRVEALRAVTYGYRLAKTLINSAETLRLLLAIARNNEYAQFRSSRKLLQQLHQHLAATRFGRRLQKQVEDNTAWQETQQRIAAIMRQHVPKKARVLIADKWDPTLFHLSRRQGWNFPDRSLMPEGYPANDEKAISHLEQLRKRGANYLVFPNAAFWWLDHYRAFRQHLEVNHACIWQDERCVIYQI